jgi:hypothetical protein
MKIRVEHKDGTKKTITLVPPVTIFDSPYDVPEGVGMLTHIHCGDGTDHYFTFNEGFYDGWGRGVNCSADEAVAEIKRTEEGREKHGDM